MKRMVLVAGLLAGMVLAAAARGDVTGTATPTFSSEVYGGGGIATWDDGTVILGYANTCDAPRRPLLSHQRQAAASRTCSRYERTGIRP